jgi:hypothetical protein
LFNWVWLGVHFWLGIPKCSEDGKAAPPSIEQIHGC